MVKRMASSDFTKTLLAMDDNRNLCFLAGSVQFFYCLVHQLVGCRQPVSTQRHGCRAAPSEHWTNAAQTSLVDNGNRRQLCLVDST